MNTSSCELPHIDVMLPDQFPISTAILARRPGRMGDVSLKGSQTLLDVAALKAGHTFCLGIFESLAGARWRCWRFRLTDSEDGTFSQKQAAFDDVGEFTRIAPPVIDHEALNGLRTQFDQGPLIFLGKLLTEMLHQ